MSNGQGEQSSPSRTTYTQVDLMKAAAIALVILDHSITHEFRGLLLPYFWELTAIPLFLIIMGFNAGNSFRSHEERSRKGLYPRDYLRRKLDRYARPFLATCVVGLVLAAAGASLGIRIVSSFGFLPFWGPGIWFVPVALTSIVVLPAAYRLFVWKPHVAVVLLFLTDLLQHIALYLLTSAVPSESLAADLVRFVFLTSITIYLFPIGLGFWFSQTHGLTDPKNIWFYPVFVLSLVYMVAFTFFGFRLFFVPEVGFEYNLLVMPYSAFLFILGMRLLPSQSHNRGIKILARVGRASYHILMVQSVYFSILYVLLPGLPTEGVAADSLLILLFYLTNFLICAGAGLLWYSAPWSRNASAARTAETTPQRE